ncbi:MAG: hypothetical protein KJ666_11785 [Bacteroidetes bacterium]|nr:hypothetical protein [Bacteroidota bacterium]
MSVIILPKKNIKEINDNTVLVEIPDDKDEIKKRRKKVLEECLGILKDWDIDPVEYQRKLRSEWDERSWQNI